MTQKFSSSNSPKTKPLLIGLTGYAGVGKDTVADLMVKDYGFIRFAFADKLKNILSDIYNVPRQLFDDRALKNEPCRELGWKTPREAAKLIGTEGFRNMIRRDTWVDFVMRQVEREMSNMDNHPGGIVITDVRFPEEFNAVVARGGFMIGVMRQDHETFISHESESHIADLYERCHDLLHNNGPVEDLKFKVVRALGCIETLRDYGHKKEEAEFAADMGARGTLPEYPHEGRGAQKRMGAA